MTSPRMACLVLLALAGADAAAQDWSRFRGPNGTGISDSKNIPVTWTEKDFKWRVKIPGESHSTPVVWGDHLYIESATGTDRMLLCIQKSNGKEVWSKKYPMPADPRTKHKFNSFASSTPAVDAERVYGLFAEPGNFFVRAWDHSGKEVWNANLGPFNGGHGLGASPVVFDGKLIVTNDQDGASFIVALDVKTGKEIWKCPRQNKDQGTAYGTPTILERKGMPTQILTTSAVHGISSIDAKTGEMLWEAKVFDKRAVSSPVVAGDLVLGSCGAGGGGNYVAAVRLGGKGDVTTSHLAYTVKESAPYVPTPLVRGDRIYWISDDGIASCVDASTGRVIWKERIKERPVDKIQYYGSPVLIDGRIYSVNSAGELAVWAAADSFKLLARNPIGEGSHSTPCVDGDHLYIKTFTHLVCVGGK